MKRFRQRAADAPRLNALASCLATALALGTSALVPAHAHANVPPPLPASGAHATAAAPTLSLAERDMVMNTVNGAIRTPPAVPATSIPVTNCNDSGAGSLRDAVNAAVDGDTVDMSALACSTITLTSGAISIGVNNLTLQGPGILSLEVSGNDTYRVFWHIGTGTLTVNDMRVTHGKKYLNDGDIGNAGGACIFSGGSLAMNHAWAKYCDTGSSDVDNAVHGGAVYATSAVTMGYSLVTSSTAHSSAFQARGGGVYTPGQLFMLRSTVSGNTVTAASAATGGGVQVGSSRPEGVPGIPGHSAGVKYSSITGNSASSLGGGAYFTGDAAVGRSTISGNQSCRAGGLYFVNGANVTQPASLYSSTVSSNTANCTTGGAGVAIWSRNSSFKDTTIAFNTTHSGGSTKYGAGLRIPNANTIDLQNTIIASNFVDFGAGPLADDVGGTGTMTGAANLVYFPSSMVTPGGTILLTDPMLRALASNGGPTATNMPNYGSAVIDVGNNASGVTVDQRGTGYPRILGPAADIGAVEFDLPDSIFANGFDL